MNKKLLTQIKNEWRSNLWLVTELLLVSVVMWYIVDYMYVKAAVYYEPRGFDISHCYLIQMGRLTDKSPDFIPNQTKEQQREDVKGLAERLKYRPDIEAVGFGQNSYPYNGSNSGTEVRYDTLQSPGWTIRRLVSPDFVRVFQYHGTRGETPEQLAELLSHPKNFLASDNLYKKRYGRDLTPLVGKQFYLFGDTTETYTLGASLEVVRYSDYEQAWNSYSMVKLLPENWYDVGLELCVRVKEDQDKDFITRLKADSEKLYRVGNVFIAEVRSFDDIRRNYQQSQTNSMRSYILGMVFLLLNIFVLNIDFLLFLTLNTCVSSDNANVINAIVCPTSILDCSNVKSPIGSVVVPNPIINAAKVSPPIIIPWYITRHVIPFVNTPFFVSLGFLFIMSAFAGSNASASAGKESVTRFIHKIWIGSNISK